MTIKSKKKKIENLKWKIEKIEKVFKVFETKIAKTCDIKSENQSMTNKASPVTYYQTLTEVFWP